MSYRGLTQEQRYQIPSSARRKLGIKAGTRIQVEVDADIELTRIAARFKAKGGISYADCFAAALAKHNKATLLTGDHEFEQLEKEIEIVWL